MKNCIAVLRKFDVLNTEHILTEVNVSSVWFMSCICVDECDALSRKDDWQVITYDCHAELFYICQTGEKDNALFHVNTIHVSALRLQTRNP